MKIDKKECIKCQERQDDYVIKRIKQAKKEVFDDIEIIRNNRNKHNVVGFIFELTKLKEKHLRK